MHYLDNAATTRVLPEAAEAAVHAMCEEFGNPSSLHRMGLEASHLLEDSRRTVASALGCLPEEVYFTACGTESTNISLRGTAHLNRHKKGRIITTEIEHAATINTAKQLAADGFDVVFLAPDATGHITPEVLSEALTEDTILLSCQLVNNEIGTVQPVEQLGKLLKAKAPKALFHIDAVQGLCRVRLTPKKWNCDLMSVSGHKIGAPKGIGALYVKKGLRLPPLTFGGGQERGMRPGTEAVPNIAAFAKACEIRMAHFDEDYAHVQELADYLKQQVSAELPDAVINGFPCPAARARSCCMYSRGTRFTFPAVRPAPRASRAVCSRRSVCRKRAPTVHCACRLHRSTPRKMWMRLLQRSKRARKCSDVNR